MRKFSRLQKYFLLTFAITWALWLPSVLHGQGVEVASYFLALGMMASMTPSIVALVFFFSEGKKEELKKKFSLSFSKRWLIILPVLFFGSAFVALGVTRMVDPSYQSTSSSFNMLPLVFIQMLVVGGALGEEIGWRGYAYDRLKEVYTPFTATLFLGLIWSIWHLPLFFMVGTVQSSLPVWQFLMQNTLLAFFYYWVYEQTDGNLWLMIYLHGVANTAAWLFPYWQTDQGRLIGLGVLLISYSIVKPLKIGK